MCDHVQGSAAAGTGYDAENAAALSDALLIMTIVPWTLCVLCYCGLHFTYPADREAAQVGVIATPAGVSGPHAPRDSCL